MGIDNCLSGASEQVTWKLIKQDGQSEGGMCIGGNFSDGGLVFWVTLKIGNEGCGNLIVEVSVSLQACKWGEDSDYRDL